MKTLRSFAFFLIILLIPLLVIMSSIRVLLIPYLYIDFEYHLPGFPADPYGFSLEDRLQWSKVAMDYLLNDQPLSWLADQKLADGSPLFVDRELSHMLDVKNLIQAMLIAWWVLLAVIVSAGVISWHTGYLKKFWHSISTGGWLTIGLILTILLLVVVSFDWLFTNFHRIFFTGESWLFYYSDNLIRLFPIRFWQDIFIWMGVLTIIFSLLIGYIGRLLYKRT